MLEAAAVVISSEIKKKTFDYLKHFPKGTKLTFSRQRNSSLPLT